MNQKFSSLFKNLSYSVFANGINTLVSIILVLFVPKLLGVKEYSYWQLYLFYASYVGFFHFGWADGVYLRFGGKNYNELDKRYFNTQFWLLTFMEVAVAAIISVVSILTISDMNKKVILIYISVCCVLQLPRTLLQYLLQTTNRISDYAKNYMLDRLAYAVLVIGMLLLGIRNYEMLICADLFARGFTLVLLCLTCRDIVFKKVSNICSGVRDAWCNIAVGSKLMVANIASLLITGIVRLAIENHWSIETFGKVSLTMTVSNLLMVFINAVSIVMYLL